MKNKTCPRCGSAFICRDDDILKCDCTQVVLSPEASKFIGDNYGDCLCLSCLKEINNSFLAQNKQAS